MTSNDENRSKQKNPQDQQYYRDRGDGIAVSKKKALRKQKEYQER